MDVHNNADIDGSSYRESHRVLIDLLSCLLKVIRFLKLYPSTHPFIGRAVDDLRELWKTTRSAHEEITFEARTGSILIDGTEAVRSPRSLSALKNLLADKGLEGFAVHRDTEFSELRDLAALLARPREEVIEKNVIKPVHLVGLKGVRLAHGTTAASREVFNPFSTYEADAERATLSRLLAGALPRQEAPTSQPGSTELIRLLLDRSPAPPDVGKAGNAFETSPDILAFGVATAVNQLLMGAENPSTDDLLSAFAYCLERIVSTRLHKEGGGFHNVEKTIETVLSTFDRKFTRRMLPERPDGRLCMQRLLRRFSPPLKLQVLKDELMNVQIDRSRFQQVIEALSVNEEEEDELLGLLTRSVTEDRRFETSYDRIAQVIGLGPRSRRRRGIVLAMEPNPDAGRRFRLHVEHEELELHMLDDGGKLLGEVERLRPDVVVIEPKIRGIHGLELISQLRRARHGDRSIPLIVYSEEASFQHAFEVKSYPGHHFVPKSEGPDRVTTCIRGILKNHTEESVPSAAMIRDDFRPSRDMANQHFFVPNFEILTFHHADAVENMTYFDVIPIDEHRTTILLADGFRSIPDEAETCARLRKRMRNVLSSDQNPRRLVSELNGLFHDQFRGRPLIATHALLLDSHDGTVTSCLAGGMRPVKVTSSGDCQEIAVPSGIVLGFSRSQVFEASLKERTLPLEAGETLLVYSYGLASALGRGEEKNALGEIQTETTACYQAERDSNSRLLTLRDRIASRLTNTTSPPMDRAAIWIRRLLPTGPSAAAPERTPELIHSILSNPN